MIGYQGGWYLHNLGSQNQDSSIIDNTRRLGKETQFFISYPSNEVLQSLTAMDHIHGESFSLVVNYWDLYSGIVPDKLQFKIYASRLNLSLIYWNVEVVASLICNLRVPHQTNRSSLPWEDLSSSNIHFYCKDLSAITEAVEIIVGSFIYIIKVVINYSTIQIQVDNSSSSQDKEHDNMTRVSKSFDIVQWAKTHVFGYWRQYLPQSHNNSS